METSRSENWFQRHNEDLVKTQLIHANWMSGARAIQQLIGKKLIIWYPIKTINIYSIDVFNWIDMCPESGQ